MALAICAAGVSGLAQSSRDQWWPGYGNGPDNSRYFASRQVNKTNVSQLQLAWSYPFGETGSAPIVVRGVAYGRGRNGSLVAVDAKTGREIWVRENMQGMTRSGFNYWESADGRDQRLIFAMNSLLQEVDAKTGKSIMTFGTNGVVDLREGIDGRDSSTITNIQSNWPGEVFENLIIQGSAPGEGYMSPIGDVRAYDVQSGKLVWTFHTVPRPGEYGYDTWPKDAHKYVGGTNAWGEFTVDTTRGIVYFPIGSPTYDYYGADRVGANLFGASLLALDARTGKRRWHFQFVHHDLWDLDGSAAPQLTTIRHNGRSRDVVVATNKTGWLYVFDRVTGEAIWPIEERAVPKSTMPFEESWPTQPHPTKPEPFVPHTFTVDDISPDLPAAERETFRQRLLAADNKGIFTPISLKDTVHVPTSNGGVLVGGTTSNPTGDIYIVAHNNPGILHLVDPATAPARGGGPPQAPPGQAVYQANCQVCHGANREGTDTGVPLLNVSADPANNIVAGSPRFTAPAIRTVISSGKGRMLAFPHLTTADVDMLVTYLTTPAGGRGVVGAGLAGGRGRGAGPAGSGAPPEIIAGSGSAWTRPEAGGRGRGVMPYPEGTQNFTRYTINEYNTVGNKIRPPFTSIVKYNLNEPAIKWRIPYGDDPALAARGISGTSVPGLQNGLIVTASGLLFGAGGDNVVRAWDTDNGRELWSARFGGNMNGQMAMYEMDGRQYLLVPAASTAGGRGAGPASAPAGAGAPLGWVAYSLPAR